MRNSAETLSPIAVSSDALPAKPSTDLDHLPGPRGNRLTGNLADLLPNPGPFILAMRRRYGDCFTVGVLWNRRQVILTGPQANRLVLLDEDGNFSSRWGWDVVHDYFARMVLVRDFEDHRQHRRIMTGLFKSEALKGYLAHMEPIIETSLEDWHGEIDVYALQKRLALDIALRVFCGFEPDAINQSLNAELSRVLDNVLARRSVLPWTRSWRARRARDRVRRVLRAELAERRVGDGTDLFSRLATETDDQGRRLADADVVDHMIGMLFAAHDTTASSLTMICLKLAESVEWQERLRIECREVRDQTGRDALAYESLDAVPLLDAFFREALRYYSPLQFIPRRSIRAFEFNGSRIPANAPILLVPQATHFDAAHFPEPDRFDPLRFITHARPDPFAFIPFGRGSHMCLGMHFAAMEVKAVLYSLLLRYAIKPASSKPVPVAYLPIVRPARPALLRLEAPSRADIRCGRP